MLFNFTLWLLSIFCYCSTLYIGAYIGKGKLQKIKWSKLWIS